MPTRPMNWTGSSSFPYRVNEACGAGLLEPTGVGQGVEGQQRWG